MQFNITLRKVKACFTKPLLALGILCFLIGTTNGQTITNGNLSTGPVTSTAVAAPAGFNWSETQLTNTTFGYSANIGANSSVADNFTVPAGLPWNLVKATFYAYSTNYAGITSPFNDVRVRIYNTNPSVGAPAPIFGNLTTNRFLASSTASLYRVTSAGGTARQIWKIEASLPTTLTAGNYWIEWTLGTIAAGASNFSPPSTVVGTTTQAGNNAVQNLAGVWSQLTDVGPQDMPFSIDYTTTCLPATTPTAAANPTSACANSPVTLSVSGGTLNNNIDWKWYTGSCGGTLVGTGATITVTPSVTTTYFVRGEGGSCTPGNGPCGQVTVSITPCTCLTPDVATICEGVPQRLSVTGTGAPASVTVNSPAALNLVVPDANAAGITTALSVTLPAGASVTSVVTNINMTHTWDGDMVFNLTIPGGAPNSKVLNLINARGGSGDNFTNTNVSTLSANSFATGAPPFTGTFAPDAASAVGPTGAPSNIAAANIGTNLSSTPSGVNSWILGMRDLAGGDIGTLINWGITVNYTVLPTAVWTGGTFFLDQALTIPYVAGTQANAVWVAPSVTTPYTATITGGPCNGPNTVTVTVLQRPVLTIGPATSCASTTNTLTVTGAPTYVWSPATGLSSTTASSVIANPSTTTTYTVVGTGANGCKTTSSPVTVNAAPSLSVISAVGGATFQVNEAFTGTFPPAGWNITNNSAPGGTTSWFKPTAATSNFNSALGDLNYAAANYLNTNAAAANDISTWFLSPLVNIKNGDVITFKTRTNTGGTYPDRLQLRLSTNGASGNVGTTTTSVGDFTTLLLDINPTLQTGTAYPNVWTTFTVTVSGITGTVPGRFALRYFVTGGGGGANSDYIGVDDVQYSTPATVICPNVTNNIKVDITGGISPYTLVYSNGTSNTTFSSYVSGTNIQVSPAVTTTYSVVSVTGANGCTLPASGIGSGVTITVTPPVSITTQPAAITVICAGNNATFTAAVNTITGTTYQWQQNTVLAPGAPVWTNITNAGVYSGATTNALTITAAPLSFNGYSYRLAATGACNLTGVVNSNAATLTVNAPATVTVTTASPITICQDASTTISATAVGNSLTYQWQVNTVPSPGVPVWINLANGANYTGVTTNTLTLVSVPSTWINYQYRVQVTSGGCTATNSSVVALGTINPKPIVVVTAAPITKLFPGLTTTLTAASSPAAVASYQWIRNGNNVPGATSNRYVVNIDALGSYSVRVVDVNGCSSIGVLATPITDSANSEVVFIYPSPNSGNFQVRFYNDLTGGGSGVGIVNIYDTKGSRVFTQTYSQALGYRQMNVNLGAHAAGIYRVDVLSSNGERLKTGNVMVF